jgi:Predicted transcriptional regulators
MSQENLAKLSKVGRSTISNIETQRYTPGVDVALHIAATLNCKVEDLFVIKHEIIDK